MAIRGSHGFRWTPPGGTEQEHTLNFPPRIRPVLLERKRRWGRRALDLSTQETFTVGDEVEGVELKFRFVDLPRSLQRALSFCEDGGVLHYYPDLARSTSFPLEWFDAPGGEMSVRPDRDRHGFGEGQTGYRFRSSDGTPLWPLYSPVRFTGTASENLLRDAAMDTDTDVDGVVDGFTEATTGTGWTFSLNGTDGAQEMTADGTGAKFDSAAVAQHVLRVFEGDEVTVSVEHGLFGATDLEFRHMIRWEGEAGFITNTVWFQGTATPGSYQRDSNVLTVPADATLAIYRLRARLTAAGGSGDARVRNARLLRASSDPATYANPHVSGASQTGSTLVTAGWPVSQSNVVRRGDAIRVGGSGETQAGADAVSDFWRAREDVDADANGDATIPLTQPIGSAPPDGAALRLQHPMFS